VQCMLTSFFFLAQKEASLLIHAHFQLRNEFVVGGGEFGRYGPLFKSSLFFRQTVFAAEVETVKMIVAKEWRSVVSDYPTSFALLLGRFNGLNLQGESWKRLRRFVVSTIMRVDLLKARMADIEDLVVQTLDSWTDDRRTIFVEDETKTVYHPTRCNTLPANWSSAPA
jgi:cytochrome P450